MRPGPVGTRWDPLRFCKKMVPDEKALAAAVGAIAKAVGAGQLGAVEAAPVAATAVEAAVAASVGAPMTLAEKIRAKRARLG